MDSFGSKQGLKADNARDLNTRCHFTPPYILSHSQRMQLKDKRFILKKTLKMSVWVPEERGNIFRSLSFKI